MKFHISNPLKVVEERPTPKEIYNWKIYGSALILAACAIAIGFDSGFIGGDIALTSFKEEFGFDKMTSEQADFITSNIISVFHGGCFFGSIFSYTFAYFRGRKFSLVISALCMCVGAVLMMLPSRERGLVPMYLGRVIAGVGVGISTAIVPVYLAELSPSGIRGRVHSMYEIGWRIGDTTGFFIAYGVSANIKPSFIQWYIPFIVQLVPAALYITGVWFLVESPRWLFLSGQYEKGLKNLSWIRNLSPHHEYIEWEVENIEKEIEEQKVAVGLGFWDPFREIFTKPHITKRLALTSSLYIIQSLFGIQSINYFSPTIFQEIGVVGTTQSLFSSGLFGVDKFISTIIWSLFVVEQFGRRTTLLATSPVCMICFFYIGGYCKFSTSGPEAKAALGMIYIWCFFFIMGWSGTPYVLGAEVFDNNIRAACQAINSMMLWLGVFLMARFTTDMINEMSYGVFFFFAGWAFISIPLVYFFLPETKGISLEHMDRLFAKPAWIAHKELLAELAIEEEEREQELGLAGNEPFNHPSASDIEMVQNDFEEKSSAQYVEDRDKT